MGKIYLYHGSGGGKTTNALGLALRSVGHGNRVIIVQFMKGRKDIGEYKIAKRLHPDYEIYQFGSEDWVDLKNPSEEDKRRAREGLLFAQKTLKLELNLLILYEIGLAAYYGLLETDDVLELLRNIPKKTDVVITGRKVPEELIDRADFVNEVIDVKHPRNITAVKGIQY
ncbi:cob(I)yrinic acid a,c-diamide adenosyltransferase [Candidatus Bathyarchaeota archaeon]|nr:cob(I)yrinic acid a,c-diamide adenosyltransferase [Candidatus Bathyarchaeota archaeon]